MTDRVRSTTVRYCFHRCLSVHTSGGYPGQVQLGGTPARSCRGGVPHLGYLPPIRPGRGYPCWEVPPPQVPCQIWPGGTPAGGYPHLRYPLSDLARGVPLPGGGNPTSGTTAVRPDQGVPLLGGYPTSGTPHQTWPGGYPCWGVPYLR